MQTFLESRYSSQKKADAHFTGINGKRNGGRAFRRVGWTSPLFKPNPAWRGAHKKPLKAADFLLPF